MESKGFYKWWKSALAMCAQGNKRRGWRWPWRHEGSQEPPAEGQGGVGQGGVSPLNTLSSAAPHVCLMLSIVIEFIKRLRLQSGKS